MPELGEPISERELDVLNCLAEGASNREIADRLSISHNTVKVHMRNIFTKLGVSSRTEATTVALQKGMLSIPGVVAEEVEAEEEEAEIAEAGDDGEQPVVDALETGDPGEGTVAGETVEDSSAAVLQADGDEAAVVARGARAPGNRLNRRVMLAIIGLLSVLVLALALNSLLRGNAQTPPTATSGAGVEGTPFEETAVGENWVSSRPLPAARAGMAVASVGLNVYAIGGEGEQGPVSSVFIFDSQQQVWREGAQKLTAVTAAAAGVLEGEIYVAGGYGTNGEATTTVEAYSPLNNAWRPVTSLPRSMAGAVAVVSDGLLYLFGGEDGTEILDEGYVYDPGTQQWLALPPLGTARTFAVGGALGGKLFVVGGSDGNDPLTVCEAYDPAAEQWQACPELSQPRAAAGSAAFLNKLYVVGGTEPMEVAAGDAPTGEVYDASLDAWSTFNMPMLADDPDWRYLGVSNVETHIYALGGERGGQMSDGLFIYRPLVHTYFIPAASAGGD